MREQLGVIVRLQVQTDPVKERGIGYLPHRILAVPEIALTRDGALGRHGDAWVVDVHHSGHPLHGGGNRRAISVGFTSHYDAMQDRFGATVIDGIAGENVIVAANRRITEDDLGPGLVVRTGAGDEVTVDNWRVAAPCAEFTSHLLARPDVGAAADIADALDFLRQGTRGFVAPLSHLDAPVTITLGDEVWLEG